MKLFAIYVGGELPGANIELHDMRFVAAGSIRDTYGALRRQWWGTPKSLHIDCWAEIDHADGYDVTLRAQPFDGEEKLYYVNLGGYDQVDFAERHKNMFVVATSVSDAKTRALKSVNGWRAAHKDDLYQAEQAFSLQDGIDAQRLHVHLSRSAQVRTLQFTCDYTPIRPAGRSTAERPPKARSASPPSVI